jgi:histone chaperone ASF1
LHNRDTEESAPAEYPPDQPEADTLDDDGTAYGAEEAEMQAALEKELAETEAAAAAAAKQATNGEDHEMAGTDELPGKVREDDEVSEAGSEDLEADSSGSDDEDEEEEGGEGAEGEADEDMEMAEGEDKPAEAVKTGEQKPMPQQGQPQVMVH